MKLLDTLKTIERIDQLIRLKATGTPTQLAYRLELSERSVYYLIKNMKDMGAPIIYNKERQSYCYEENNVAFKFGFYCGKDEMMNLYGGLDKKNDLFFEFNDRLQNFCNERKYHCIINVENRSTSYEGDAENPAKQL